MNRRKKNARRVKKQSGPRRKEESQDWQKGGCVNARIDEVRESEKAMRSTEVERARDVGSRASTDWT